MKKKYIQLITLFFVTCLFMQAQTAHLPLKKENKTDIALKFINGYVKNCNKYGKAVGIVAWVNSNNLATKCFKAMVDDTDIDADPLFDAQAWPDKGFELDSINEQANYIIVKGINWSNFKLTLKMTEENGKWLVDGCGTVNIPAEKRPKR